MSLAERTRQAVRERPFLLDALRAGVLNYTATARFLDVGETEAVAAALRRFAADLGPYEPPGGTARVTMETGLGVTPAEDARYCVGEVGLSPGEGSLTAVRVTGIDGAATLAPVLARLDAAEIPVRAAGATDEDLLVAVRRRDGPATVEHVEAVVRS